jgi:bifunctional enzyme CysN/CysC
MPQQVTVHKQEPELQCQMQEDQSLVRLITCGSVDDGKSTLIGRLLYESKVIYKDQLETLKADSKKFGTTGEELDFSLLVDGLMTEREQNITIDVAYKFLTTDKRKFIIADTPGHEQYTRNMATGASTADLAIVIIDARKGILTQTRRHTFILSMLGVENIILAVNKMDLVNYDQESFLQIERDYREVIKKLKIENLQCIPISSLHGDNIVTLSEHMPWYTGMPLLTCLETISINEKKITQLFRMPIQWINRPHLDFRGFSGTIASGTVCIGDKITILPSGKQSTVKDIVVYNSNLQNAGTDQAITILLEDEIDISRGDVFIASEKPCEVADQFETYLLWMSDKEMVPHRQYIFQAHTVSTLCTLNHLKCRIDINTGEHIISKPLLLNEIGICEIALNHVIAFEPYEINCTLGAFILIDRLTNETVAAGMIRHALRRSLNVHKQLFKIDEQGRSSLKNQQPCVIWITGLPSAGKSTIANALEEALHKMSKHTMLLDGDNIRLGLNRDLGFTNQARAENIRRIAEVSKLMTEAGLITIVSCISPFRAEREMSKGIIGDGKFIEVFVNTPLEEAEKRDVKGLYKKARAGEIPNFTGIGSAYELPETPHVFADTMQYPPQEIADQIIQYLSKNGFLNCPQ